MGNSVFFGRGQHTCTAAHVVIVHLGDVVGSTLSAHWV